MLRQGVYGQALGWEDLNDHTDLRLDVAIRTAVGGEHEVASAPTLCRLESWSDRRTAVDLHRVLVEQCIASFKTAPEELVLDLDATDNPLRMLLAALAYVLIERMPAMATAQVDTLCIKLLKVAAAITRNHPQYPPGLHAPCLALAHCRHLRARCESVALPLNFIPCLARALTPKRPATQASVEVVASAPAPLLMSSNQMTGKPDHAVNSGPENVLWAYTVR